MSSLGPQQQNLSFGDILQVPGGVTGQLQQVQDGSGNITGLWLSSVGSNVLNSIVEEQIFTATAGQTVFNLTTMTYEPATYMLQVYVDGLNQIVNVDYLETNATTVTFLSGLSAGQLVKFTTANGSVSTTVNASNITLVGANGVTGVVQDIADPTGADFIGFTGANGTAGTVQDLSAVTGADLVGFTGVDGTTGTVADLATADGSSFVGFVQAGTGAVTRDTQSKLRDVEVSPEDFGAVGNGVDNDTDALNKAFATGKIVNGHGKTYKVIGDTIIDPYATSGVGYGPNKSWFRAGVCRNINFVGDVSFGIGSNFLGKRKHVADVAITGDCRLSSWYTDFQGMEVSGTTYLNGDYPPDTNWVGCYYNQYRNCDFGNVVIDQRYGPFNMNNFTECQFGWFLVKDSGNTGYDPSTLPFKAFHMNTFFGCEWTEGYTAPDGRTYSFVIDDSAVAGGINKIIGSYQEMTYRGFYGVGLEVNNIHNSGATTGTYIGGPAGNARLGFQSPISGEGGFVSRDVPHVYPVGQLAMGGDWSILNSNGYPVCLVPNAMTGVVATDATEPTGLGKAVTFSGGAFSAIDLVPQVNATASPKTLMSFAIIYKQVSGAPTFEVTDESGTIIYGAENVVYLDNSWIMAVCHSYSTVRLLNTSTWSIKISAVSIGRGAGVISPFTQQNNNKSLIDLSESGSSYVDDAIFSYLSKKGGYFSSKINTSLTSASSTDWYQIPLGNFSGRGMSIRVQFCLFSAGGGARNFYRESIVNENGGASLAETNISAISGANGSLSFVLSGSTLTVRTATASATAEIGRMAIEIIGYGVPALVIAL